MGIPDHLTCLLRNLFVDQEATVRTPCGTTDWFQIKKGVQQGCLFSPCLFNLYAEHIMRNAGLDELQARIKIDGRDINSPRYADDATLLAETEEELKSLLMRVKEENERAGLRLNKNTKIVASGLITAWQIEREKVELVTDFPFLHSSVGKESACNVEDLGLIPGLGRSSGEEKGYPLQYSVLENSMDCIVLWVAKSQTRLSDFHFTL